MRIMFSFSYSELGNVRFDFKSVCTHSNKVHVLKELVPIRPKGLDEGANALGPAGTLAAPRDDMSSVYAIFTNLFGFEVFETLTIFEGFQAERKLICKLEPNPRAVCKILC
ncbi:hypothetical protein L1987_75350 [Smallanthus sonchifolius]|uniref:Uncharacterized protein n=1 Tax=Smallanthus sonchifolius TaxID=185202 RepID=A0ACB9A5H3_9ASTR|nr:hypothetical protein L1987_75350 [Smallanthus sonchifolius]